MSINMNNYEEWMVAFIDGELSVEEISEFNLFLEKNPALKGELEDYKSLQLEANEEVIFENKNTLYKKESTLVLLKKAWPLAAAVVLLLAILPFIKEKNPDTPVKVVKEKRVETNTSTPTKKVIATDKEDETSIPNVQPSKPYTAPAIAKKAIEKTDKKPRTIIQKKKQKPEYIETNVPQKKLEQTPEQEQFAKEVKKEIPAPIINKPEQKAVVQNVKRELEPNKLPTTEEQKDENLANGLVVFSEESTPALHDKLNEVVTKVEDNIETIKKLKKAPITVSIGKRKLFTLNTARAAQAN